MYVLVTPARDEAGTIARTIESVLSQTLKPARWSIVDDGSNDRTAEIAAGYASRSNIIRVVTRPRQDTRNFRSKVQAVELGRRELADLPYRFIGFLDADVSFEPAYFEGLLAEFDEDSTLGIAGGLVHEQIGGRYRPQKSARHSVAGAVQMFRRDCYEQIGGYQSIPTGGIDAVAEITARMHGWRVRAFPALKVYHHRRVGGAGSLLQARFRTGATFHGIGYGPLYMALRCAYKVAERPIFLGALMIFLGYLRAAFRPPARVVSPAFREYLQREQRSLLRQVLRLKRTDYVRDLRPVQLR